MPRKSRSSIQSHLFRSTGGAQPEEQKDTAYKGDDGVDIDEKVNQFKALLNKLRNISDKSIRSLQGTDLEDFRQVADIVSTYYPTSDYEKFHAQVKDAFGDLADVQPGTVGAYATGCLLQTNFPGNQACSILCLGGIPPPPDGSDWKFCETQAYWITKGDSDMNVTPLNTINNKYNALVYVDEELSKENFLNDTAVRYLAKNGVKRIKTYAYSEGGKNYTLIGSDAFTALRSVSFKQGETRALSRDVSDSDDTGMFWLMILVAVVVVILVCCFRN